MRSAAPLIRRGSATGCGQRLCPRTATSATRRTGCDLRCCDVAAAAADPVRIDPMGGGGGDHQAATERHLRPVRQAAREPAARVPVQLGAPRHNQAGAGARRLRPVRQAVRRPEREPADPRLPARDGDFRKRRTARKRKVRAAARAAVRAGERDKQRAKIAAVRERERQRSRAQAARLKASYELRLAAAKAKTGQQHKGPERPKPRPRRPPHEYQSCADKDCQRPVCVAFKEGHREGYQQGFEQGDAQGYARGFIDGIAACPRAHQ